MAEFTLKSILNDASIQDGSSPAGPRMTIRMIPRAEIVKNPDNSIYVIGDVSRLKEDIAENGIRQPLEVMPMEDGRYMLIGGERRMTACDALAAGGDPRFDRLPCIVRPSKGAAEDKIALITANATARELTDGERLGQYEAMKTALEQMKADGHLEGRVRDEMVRRLGESSGSLGRLGAIAANCSAEVKQMLRDGKCGITKAYEASQIPRRAQGVWLRTGQIPAVPSLTAQEYNAVIHWLVNDALEDVLKKVNWESGPQYYLTGANIHIDGKIVENAGENVHILHDGSQYCMAYIKDPEDPRGNLRQFRISFAEFYTEAKKKYQSPADAEREAAERAAWKNTESGSFDAKMKMREKAKKILDRCREWPVDADLTQCGLRLHRYDLPGGEKIYALIDMNGGQDCSPLFQLMGADGVAVPDKYKRCDFSNWNTARILDKLTPTLAGSEDGNDV